MLKCLIWDLDHTLWEGTLAEQDKLIFTDEKRELIERIDKLGILQSIASRNDLQAAMDKLEEFGIKDYFLYPQCGYQSKATSVKTITEKLNIGIDAVGFIDDNEFELGEVGYFIPEVRLYHIQKDYLKLIDELNHRDADPTYESAHRREMMVARQEREAAEKEFTGSREDFLKSCGMELTIRAARMEDGKRICELASRSNQLNSLTEVVDASFFETYLNGENHNVIVTELKDSFGYHGIVGVCFLDRTNTSVLIKQFCISCRTEGRGISSVFLSEIIQSIQKLYPELKEIHCGYNMTLRNRPALVLLKLLGFRSGTKQEKLTLFHADLPMQAIHAEWLSVNNVL